MKLSTNVGIQSLGLLLHTANIAVSSPEQIKFWVSVVIGVVQIISAVKAHLSNPDGSPAQLPWVKDDSKK